ncbi:MAG: hypothetical protein EOP05_14620, partial [Proteobacteria bacterium]
MLRFIISKLTRACALALLISVLSFVLFSPRAHAQGVAPSDTTGASPSFKDPSFGTRSRGNSFNPDIGVNALFLYENSNRGRDSGTAERNGLSFQEAELQFTSDVDPYWRFVSTFSLHQEVDDATTPAEREYVFEAEEAFAETIALPRFIFRIGKFKTAMGKQNQIHTHALAFIDNPLQNTVLLGDEGLNDLGVSLSGLLPTPWFSELTLQGISGQGEGLEYFQPTTSNSYVGLFHWKNLIDLTEDLTSELGLSAASGKNQSANSTQLYGADLTFKWRATAEQAVIWSTELLRRDYNQETSEVGQGVSSWVQLQFSRRWWAQARAEYLEVKDPASTTTVAPYQRKQSALVAYVPS